MVRLSAVRAVCLDLNLVTELKKEHTLFYQPFPYFAGPPSSDPGAEYVSNIERLIEQGSYANARIMAQKLIRATLDGLRYLET